MKPIDKFIQYIIYSVMCLLMTGCNKDVTDFGFDGSLSGTIKTPSGAIVPGDITNNSLYIQALGDGDRVTTVIRVNGDGTYQNTKLFPVKTKIWITGAVKNQGTDTIEVDFSSKNVQVQDFIVIPFLTIKPPVVNGSPSETSINIDYEITGNDGNVSNTRNIYCGTYPFPNGSIGSGTFYTTKVVSLPSDIGTGNITGLTSKTKYYIRIGAKAAGSSYENFSEQITVTTP